MLGIKQPAMAGMFVASEDASKKHEYAEYINRNWLPHENGDDLFCVQLGDIMDGFLPREDFPLSAMTFARDGRSRTSGVFHPGSMAWFARKEDAKESIDRHEREVFGPRTGQFSPTIVQVSDLWLLGAPVWRTVLEGHYPGTGVVLCNPPGSLSPWYEHSYTLLGRSSPEPASYAACVGKVRGFVSKYPLLPIRLRVDKQALIEFDRTG